MIALRIGFNESPGVRHSQESAAGGVACSKDLCRAHTGLAIEADESVRGAHLSCASRLDVFPRQVAAGTHVRDKMTQSEENQ